MNRIDICAELIKLANEADIKGKHEFANNITKAASKIANVKLSQTAVVQSAPPATTNQQPANTAASPTQTQTPQQNQQLNTMDALYQSQPYLRFYQQYNPAFVQQLNSQWQKFNLLGQALQTRNVNEVIKYVNDGFAKRQYGRLQSANNATQGLINSIFEVANREYQNLARYFPGANMPGQQTTAQPSQTLTQQATTTNQTAQPTQAQPQTGVK